MNNNKVKIIFFGTPDFVLPVIKKLSQTYSIEGIVTTPDHITGRKKILTPSPVKKFASENGIKHIFTPEKFTDEFVTQLTDLKPDLYVVAAYGKIIPKRVLAIPSYGALNIHPSLLPKYRGPSPIQTAIKNGDTETGITIIKMDEKMDHGPILKQKTVALSSQDTFASLHITLFEKAADILLTVLPLYLSGTLQLQEQNESEATYCSIISKQDGFFDLDNPPDPETLDRMTRAYFPWPTAWTHLRTEGIGSSENNKKLLKLLPNSKVQLEGGKPTTIKDLLNGYPKMREIFDKLGLLANDK